MTSKRMQTRALTLSTLLVLLLTVVVVTMMVVKTEAFSSVVTEQNRTITWAFVAPLSRPLSNIKRTESFRLGAMIAFAESNIANKLQFALESYDNANSDAESLLHALALRDRVFGFLGFWGSEALINSMSLIRPDTPVVGPVNGRASLRWYTNLSAPRTDRVLYAQPSFKIEMAAIVDELASDWNVLSSVAVVYSDDNFGVSVGDAVAAMLSLQFVSPMADVVFNLTGIFPPGDHPQEEMEADRVLSLLSAKSVPTALILGFTNAEVAALIIKKAVLLWGNGTTFATISSLDPDNFGNIMLSQGVPNQTHVLITQAFINTRFGTNPLSTALERSIKVVSRTPSWTINLTNVAIGGWMVQGYASAKLAIWAAQKALVDDQWPLTRDTFWSAALTMPQQDGFGPFCNVSNSCVCNQAAHDVFVLSVSPRNGIEELVATLHWEGCGVVTPESVRTIVVNHFFGTRGSTSRLYHKGLSAAMWQHNNHVTNTDNAASSVSLLIVSQKFSQRSWNTTITTTSNTTQAPFAVLAPDRESISGIINSFSSGSSEFTSVPVFVLFAQGMMTRDAAHHRNFIHVHASINDEMYALHDFLAGTRNATKVIVVYQDDSVVAGDHYVEGLKLASKYYTKTSNHPALSYTRYGTTSLQDAINQQPSTIVMVINVPTALTAVRWLLTSMSHDHEFDLVLTSATLPTIFGAALEPIASTFPHLEHLFHSSAFFAQHSPPVTLVSNYEKSLDKMEHLGLDVYFVGRFFTEIVRLATLRVGADQLTGQDLLTEVYLTRQFVIDGITLGPYEDGQCNQGRAFISITNFDLNRSMMWPVTNYSLPSCGVVYPSYSKASDGGELVLSLVLGILLPCLLIVMLICCGFALFLLIREKKVKQLKHEKYELQQKTVELEARLSAVPTEISKLLDTPAAVAVTTLAMLKNKDVLSEEDRVNLDHIIQLVASNMLYQPNFVMLKQQRNRANGGAAATEDTSEMRRYIEGMLQIVKTPVSVTTAVTTSATENENKMLDGSTGSMSAESFSPIMSPLSSVTAIVAISFPESCQLWDFDAVTYTAINGTSRDRPILAVATVEAVNRFKLFKHLPTINREKLWLWVATISNGYVENPYHNATHALDVTQSQCWLLEQLAKSGMLDKFTDLELLAAILACPIHDYQHPGLTSNFLINVGDVLAVRYNGISVLESMHVSESINLMVSQGDLNWMGAMPRPRFLEFSQLLVKLVLATDMAKHAEIAGAFNAKLAAGDLNLDNPPDRLLLLMMCIKAADLSNSTRPWEIARMWAVRVTDEFFKQGQIEKERGLPISPMMDKDTCNIPKMQVTFGDAVVRPLYESLSKVIPAVAEVVLPSLQQNSIHWTELMVARLQQSSRV